MSRRGPTAEFRVDELLDIAVENTLGVRRGDTCTCVFHPLLGVEKVAALVQPCGEEWGTRLYRGVP